MHRRQGGLDTSDTPDDKTHKFVFVCWENLKNGYWTVLDNMNLPNARAHFETIVPNKIPEVIVVHVVSDAEIDWLYDAFIRGLPDNANPFLIEIKKHIHLDQAVDITPKQEEIFARTRKQLYSRLVCPCVQKGLGTNDAMGKHEYPYIKTPNIQPFYRKSAFRDGMHAFFVFFKHTHISTPPKMTIRRVRAMSIEGVYNMLSLYGFDSKDNIIAILHIPESAKFDYETGPPAQRLIDYVTKRLNLGKHELFMYPSKQERARFKQLAQTTFVDYTGENCLGKSIEAYITKNNIADIPPFMIAAVLTGYIKYAKPYLHPIEKPRKCSCHSNFTYDASGVDLWAPFRGPTQSVQYTFTDIPEGYFEAFVPDTPIQIWPAPCHN
jgi:hypothetical protein